MTTHKIFFLLFFGFLLSCAACYLDPQLQRTNPADRKFAVGQDCLQNEDCSAFTACVQNKCAKCKQAQECGLGRTCTAGLCVAAPMDGGIPEKAEVLAEVGPEVAPEKTSTFPDTYPSFCAPESTLAVGCLLKGTYKEELALTPNIRWVMVGPVQIGDGVTPAVLRIAAGTTVFAKTGSSLAILRGSKLIAKGTAAKPIIFTTDARSPNPGSWAGISMFGEARQNLCSSDKDVCRALLEGTQITYGGEDDADSSGTLEYVRIEYAGTKTTPALGLYAVGNETTISFLQIHQSLTGALALFGGAVDLRNLLISNALTYGMLWRDGWRGRAQFGVIYLKNYNADALVGENQSVMPNALPRSAPTLANFSLIGTTYPISRSGDGLILRQGTAAKIYSTLISTFAGVCLSISDQATLDVAVQMNNLTGDTVLDHSLLDSSCRTKFGGVKSSTITAAEELFTKLHANNQVAVLRLPSSSSLGRFDFRPQAGSPALMGAFQGFTSDFFQKVQYIGAMGQVESPWTLGWTNANF